MNALTPQTIAKLPALAQYEEAFRRATGVPLVVLAPGGAARRVQFGACENSFCALATGTALGASECALAQTRAQVYASQLTGPKQVPCYAGLTDVAVPVIVQGKHVATLMSGQVFRRQPTERDFDIVARYIGQGLDGKWNLALRAAYFSTPVVSAERFEAIIQLLNVFAQYFATYLESHSLAFSSADPLPVTRAKQYVQAHVEEPIELAEVVRHVKVSRFYFCRLFKRATGMTLTEYVTQVRMERAKALLSDPNLRISEVAFSAGFGSIPQFNTVFKRQTGVSPGAYRDSLRTEA